MNRMIGSASLADPPTAREIPEAVVTLQPGRRASPKGFARRSDPLVYYVERKSGRIIPSLKPASGLPKQQQARGVCEGQGPSVAGAHPRASEIPESLTPDSHPGSEDGHQQSGKADPPATGRLPRWQYAKEKKAAANAVRDARRDKNRRKRNRKRENVENKTGVGYVTRALSFAFDGDTNGRNDLRDAWTEWLGRMDWQLFCTFTFLKDVSPGLAGRKMNRWFKHCEQALKDFKQCGPVHLRYLASIEETCKGRMHLHAVIGGDPALTSISRKALMRCWEGLPGNVCGLCRIYPAHGMAAHYVVKYVSKGRGRGALLLAGGNFTTWSPPGIGASNPKTSGPQGRIPEQDEGAGEIITTLLL